MFMVLQSIDDQYLNHPNNDIPGGIRDASVIYAKFPF